MIDPAVRDAVYREALALTAERLDLEDDRDGWDEALRRRLAAAGIVLSDDEFLIAIVAVYAKLGWMQDEDAARDRANAVLAAARPALVEFQGWLSAYLAAAGPEARDEPLEVLHMPETGAYELLGPFQGVDPARVEQVIAMVIGANEKAARIVAPFPAVKVQRTMDPDVTRALYKFRTLLADLRVEQERRQRLERRAASRPPDQGAAGELCSSCGKKPVAVTVTDANGHRISGGLCKRCAHAEGLMPHGKIGGGA